MNRQTGNQIMDFDRENGYGGLLILLQMINAEVESIITFGEYTQNLKTDNEKTPIEWIVLSKENDQLLLISRYALDCKQYNTSRIDVTWEDSTLHKWLINDFYNNAFDSTEQGFIVISNVPADKNLKHLTNPGNDTEDKVFLLSIDEVKQYFSSDNERVAKFNGEADWWWLRSPGNIGEYAALVNSIGCVYISGIDVGSGYGGIRPALWVNLTS